MTYRKIKFSTTLLAGLEKKLLGLLTSGTGEETYCVFEMIKSFGRSVEGFKLVMRNKVVLVWLLANCHSNKTLEQGMAIEALAGMFFEVKEKLTVGGSVGLEGFNKANFGNVEALLGYYGDDKMVNLGVEGGEDEKKIQKGIDKILKYLMLPFPEHEPGH